MLLHRLAPSWRTWLCPALLVFDALLCLAIVRFVRYTEIDWVAYMQEVEGFLSGERDYSQLRGDTGPCVYPALFLYLFAGLHYLTSRGTNLPRAQALFVGLYLCQLAATMVLYARCGGAPGTVAEEVGRLAEGADGAEGKVEGKVEGSGKESKGGKEGNEGIATLLWQALTTPGAHARTRTHGQPSTPRAEAPLPAWCFVVLCLSKRVHSIYMLRMFNDGVAVLLGSVALLLFTLPPPTPASTAPTPVSASIAPKNRHISTLSSGAFSSALFRYRYRYKYRYHLGCVFYSMSVGVKMNMLLYAPGKLCVDVNIGV